MIDLTANYTSLKARIQAAEQRFGIKPQSVRLLAVSKSQSPQALLALISLGQFAFGENYVQEALSKMKVLANQNIEWHFIGPIQSNKCQALASAFHWVHTVSSLKQATLLSEKRSPLQPPLNICIQIKLDDNPNRSGIALSEVKDLVLAIQGLPRIQLRGLMTLLPDDENFSHQRQYYNLIKSLYCQLQEEGYPLDTLSMGMSNDLEAAISEGANLVRIGRALFGERKE